MIRGLYAAATALDGASQRQQATSQNLANISSPGFRRRGIVTETFEQALTRSGATVLNRTGSHIEKDFHTTKLGPLQRTGNPWDVALTNARQFFVVDGPDGELYTRNGSFGVTPDGDVVTRSGYAVQGEGGALAIPANAAKISIGTDGSLSADGVPVGRLRVVEFESMNGLRDVGPTLFRADDAVPTPAEGQVIQGSLEGSNIKPAELMVELIQGVRYFEAAQRAMRAINDSIARRTRPEN